MHTLGITPAVLDGALGMWTMAIDVSFAIALDSFAGASMVAMGGVDLFMPLLEEVGLLQPSFSCRRPSSNACMVPLLPEMHV